MCCQRVVTFDLDVGQVLELIGLDLSGHDQWLRVFVVASVGVDSVVGAAGAVGVALVGQVRLAVAVHELALHLEKVDQVDAHLARLVVVEFGALGRRAGR